MSVVTDIALVLPISSDEVVREANQWIAAQDAHGGAFVKIDQHGGGRKVHQWDMWSGAFNHFPLDAFLEAFAAIPLQRWGWLGEEDRASALIIVNTEYGDRVHALRVGEPYPWGAA